ncbi:hypothetical protein [Streptomyces niveus]|uniref:hypothetical protein n=1 Tax=Streptomyces niveus TaxID=193462 RepID=UPI00342BD0D8
MGASVLEAYGGRENTRPAHVRERRQVLEYQEFAGVEAELRMWVDARAWATGVELCPLPVAVISSAAARSGRSSGWAVRRCRRPTPGLTH